ncbi:MAG TPA: DoxX family protein [Phycisphaerae bacterium]|nr:DoxX family protein [Phycisphaerae bacterium]
MTTIEASIAPPSSCKARSKAALIIGRVLLVLLTLFLLFDASMKLAKPSFVVQATVNLGYPESSIIPLGITLLAATILYLLPKTNVLGAILLTGYLGGAVDAQLHAHASPFSLLFPAAFGILVWLSLILRDPQLRALTPARRNTLN